MKKFLSSLVLMLAVLFVSCDPAEQTIHSTYVVYPYTNASLLYADQITDSLRFVTYDSWTLDLECDWATLREEDKKGEVPAGYYAVGFANITFDTNTTGKTRDCYVRLRSYGNTSSILYRQLPVLHIVNPQPDVENEFKGTVQSNVIQYTFKFEANGDWTMEFAGEKPEWVDWKENAVLSGKAGIHEVPVTLIANTIYEDRSFTVRLTSNGVSNDMTITQKKPK